MINTSSLTSYYDAQLRDELTRGDWEKLYKTSTEWLQKEADQPIATFVQNMACLFINPPSLIRNKRYLKTVKNKDWQAVLAWYKEFQRPADQHNPYFQVMDFITQPQSKRKAALESALQDNPHNGELYFIQAMSIQERTISIEKLKRAIEYKQQFPAAYYLLGIFSLELNQLETAVNYLKQAAAQAPGYLDAHYQLGSLYSLYIKDGTTQAKEHFSKVIELDPDGGAGQDAKKVLESGSKPQYGQRLGSVAGGQRSGTSMVVIVLISLLTTLLFSGPIASLLKITSPLVGILAGVLVFIGLYSTLGRKR